MNENQPSLTYRVLVNGQGQYSLWSELSPVPEGWLTIQSGSKDECLDCIKKQWTNLRPSVVASHALD